MKHKAFHLDDLMQPEPVAVDLSRHQFLLIREGGRDPSAWKKTFDKARKMALALPKEATFDSVAEVRKYRDGLAH